jgi:hypothetical protein
MTLLFEYLIRIMGVIIIAYGLYGLASWIAGV